MHRSELSFVLIFQVYPDFTELVSTEERSLIPFRKICTIKKKSRTSILLFYQNRRKKVKYQISLATFEIRYCRIYLYLQIHLLTLFYSIKLQKKKKTIR